MSGALRILLVDDHPLFRAGVCRTLESEPDFVVVSEADSLAQAYEHLESTEYDVILLDLSLSDGSGFDLLRKLHTRQSAPKVIILSVFASAQFVQNAFRLGAGAFVTKGSAAAELHSALRAVADGGIYANAEVMALLVGDGSPVVDLTTILTEREVEVAAVLSRGATTSEAAGELGVSPKTVEAHRGNIYRKLDIRNVAQLTRLVTEHENRGAAPPFSASATKGIPLDEDEEKSLL